MVLMEMMAAVATTVVVIVKYGISIKTGGHYLKGSSSYCTVVIL